jgi:hypothetical protein
MNKIIMALLAVLLLAGCNAAAQSTASVQQVPVEIINPGVAPYCEIVPTKMPTAISDLGGFSQTEMLAMNSCGIELPKALYSSSYCSNPSANWGGVNITIPPLGQYGYVSYPKNCTLHKSKIGDNQVLLCNGPSGSSVMITVTMTCQPPSAIAPDLPRSCPKPFYAVSKSLNDQNCVYTGFTFPTPAPVIPSCPNGYLPAYKSEKECTAIEKINPVQSVPAVCPANYRMDKYGSCIWSPPECSAGYEFSSSKQCCQLVPTYPSIRACPNGYSVVGGVCKSDSRNVQYSDSKVYTFTQGSCKAAPQTDKPLPPQPTPTFCDPATGACP